MMKQGLFQLGGGGALFAGNESNAPWYLFSRKNVSELSAMAFNYFND